MPIQITMKMEYIHKIQILETQEKSYFIGLDNINQTFHYIVFKKLKFTSENILQYSKLTLKEIIEESNKNYSKISHTDLIKMLGDKGKINKLTEFFCIFGFIKFFFGYYAIVASDCIEVGKIGRNIIYKVEKIKYIPLFTSDMKDKNHYFFLENQYLELLKSFTVSKQMYFSYTYDLSKSLQRNFMENFKFELIPDYRKNFMNSKGKLSYKKLNSYYFMWNYFHIKEFYNCIKNKGWICHFIYGFFEQVECNIFGMRFLVTVISRRNRHYAGTRYLKRGINNDGNVANDVETEQILEEISTTFSDKPIISSFIQIRGSIPIYWYQETNFLFFNPVIKVNETDYKFYATLRHFSSLAERYGHPCIVVNLTKKEEINRKQETLLNEFYKQGLDYINSLLKDDKDKILYYHYDIKKEREEPKYYQKYYKTAIKFVGKTNFFSFIPEVNNYYRLSLQNGVIRTNCVDCIDRTNVYQQILGSAVLVLQLRKMGVNASFQENLDKQIYGILCEIYKRMGNVLSEQYTGSLAHKQNIKGSQPGFGIIDKFIEVYSTLQRFINNSFSDRYKQNAINLFLGKYKVKNGSVQIWDLNSDQLLHYKIKLNDIDYTSFDKYYEKYVISNLLFDVDHFDFLSNKELIIYLKKIDFVQFPLIKENDKNLKSISELENSKEKNKENKLYDYLLNYEDYLQFKYKNYYKFENEFKYENNLPLFYYIDIKSNIQVRNFYNFSLYDYPIKIIKTYLFHYKPQNSGIFSNSSYLIKKKPPTITNFYLEKDDKEGNDSIKTVENNIEILKKMHNSIKIYKSNKHNTPTNVLNHMRNFTKAKKSNLQIITNNNNSIPIGRPEINFVITSFDIGENDINSINNFLNPNINLENNNFSEDFNLENFKSGLSSEELSKDWSKFHDPFTKENAFNFIEKNKKKKKKKVVNNGLLYFDVEKKCFFKDYNTEIPNKNKVFERKSTFEKNSNLKMNKLNEDNIYHTPHKGFNLNLDINSDSKINLIGIPISIVDNYFLQTNIK